MYREATVEELESAWRRGAAVIDVREVEEFVEGHVPGARLLPPSLLTTRVGSLPRREPVYVVCASGNRSAEVTGYLNRLGVDARSVAGGTSAWARGGRPVETGLRSR